jgi:hypothetical protein
MRMRMKTREPATPAARRARRRGAALVMVMLFLVGLLMLVSTLMMMSDASVKSEYGRHRQKQLAAVVKAGIAAAVNEINVDRMSSSSYDPDGEGIGSLGADAASAATPGLVTADDKEGIPVTTTGWNKTDGILLGRVRTVVHQDWDSDASNGSQRVLVVVAAWPAFTADDAGMPQEQFDRVKQYSSAQVEISRTRPPFPANALSLTGPTSAGGGNGFVVNGGSSKIEMSDPSVTVPAVNITDQTSYSNDFLADVVPVADVLAGLDPETGAATSGESTVTNDEAGILQQNTLTKIIDGIEAQVTAASGGGASILLTQAMVDAGIAWDATKTYYVGSGQNISLDHNSVGYGTLIIDGGNVEIEGDATWNGNLIVWDNPASYIDVDNGERLNVNGVLAVINVTDAADVRMQVQQGGRLDVTGAMTVITDVTTAGTSNLGFFLDNGGQLSVTGILSLMGEGMNLDVSSGAELTINGSMSITAPDGAVTGLNEFGIKNGGKGYFTFDGDDFNTGLDELGAFFDPEGTILPITISAYWESSWTDAESKQDDMIAANTKGMP